MLFRTHYNSIEFEKNYECNHLPSKTIPDQTMSVREIMRRFASGLPLEGAKVPIYEGEDEYMPDLKTMDISEQYALIDEQKQKIADARETLQHLQKENARKKSIRDSKAHQHLLDDDSSTKAAKPIHPDPKAKLPAAGAQNTSDKDG